MNKYDEAIDRGIALLDAKVPAWCTKMQLDHLDLKHRQSCVLGQVYGEFEDGERALGLGSENAWEAVEYGFLLRFANMGGYPYLTRRWKERIRQHCSEHGEAHG